MAKTRTEATEEGELSLSARIERQQRSELARAAREKARKGQRLSRQELSALKAIEKDTLQKFGRQYIAEMPKGDFLELFGGSSKVYIEWRESQGFPWPEGSNAVSLRDVLAWYRERHLQGPMFGAANADDLLLSMASQDLKDQFIRERIEEKQITNRLKAIELERVVEGLVPIEPIQQWHDTLASLISRTREKLAREADDKFRERVEQAFDDLGMDMLRLSEERFGDGSGSDDDAGAQV